MANNFDRTNLSPEKVTVKRQRSGKVSMSLPRSDDGMVHKATGKRDNSSAAHYADAMDSVLGGPSGAPMDLNSGR